jgi:hypothetical protein
MFAAGKQLLANGGWRPGGVSVPRLLTTHTTHRRAPKLPDDRPGSFKFRICEATVRGLRRSARSGRC